MMRPRLLLTATLCLLGPLGCGDDGGSSGSGYVFTGGGAGGAGSGGQAGQIRYEPIHGARVFGSDASGNPLQSGNALFTNSQFSDNKALRGNTTAAGGRGGALLARGEVRVVRSTFNRNAASGINGQGGAIANTNFLEVINSTISNNVAGQTGANNSLSNGGGIANQAGKSAQWLGQKTIDAAVVKVVSSDLENLPAAARTALLTQLEVAAREVSPTTLGNFTLVTTLRRTLGKNITDVGSLSLERLNRAESLLAQVDVRAARVEQLAAEVQRNDTRVTEQIGRFNTEVARFDTQLAGFDLQRGDITLRINGLQTNFTRLQTDFGRLQIPRSAAAPRQRKPAAKGTKK